jgi:hypothetical protein
MAYFDRPIFSAFQGTKNGLRSVRSRRSPRGARPLRHLQRLRRRGHTLGKIQSRACPLEGTAVGLRASISFIDPPNSGGRADHAVRVHVPCSAGAQEYSLRSQGVSALPASAPRMDAWVSVRSLHRILVCSRVSAAVRGARHSCAQWCRLRGWSAGLAISPTSGLHAPGELVNASASVGRARTLRIYSHPAGDLGHVLLERASPFTLETVRESNVTCSFIADVPAYGWVRDTLGSPRSFSDDLGLADAD